MTRGVASAVIGLLAALSAAVSPAARAADEWAPGATRAAAEAALRADGPEGAAAVIDAVRMAGESSLIRPEYLRASRIEAALAAVDLLPPGMAAPRATHLVASALRMDKGTAGGGWELAQRIRKDVVRRVDTENGEPFLRALAEIYPGEPRYPTDLGQLLLAAARREDAKAAFRGAVRISPTALDAAYRLAWLEEQDGDPQAAIGLYEGILAARPDEMTARYSIAQIRAWMLNDPAGGRQALDEAAAFAAQHLGAAPAEAALARIREIRAANDERERVRGEIRDLDRRSTRLALAAGAVAVAICAAAAFLLRDRRKA